MNRDDSNKKKPEDTTTISLTQSWEIAYWCHVFGKTEEQFLARFTLYSPLPHF